MELFTIHPSKDGNWIETQDASPTLTVAKAKTLHKTGWNVHITDTYGRRYAGRPSPEGKGMTEAGPSLNMSQRTVLQYLSLTEWKLAYRLPVRAGEMMLSRLAHFGWIETRGENHLTEIRLTEAGLRAMQRPT